MKRIGRSRKGFTLAEIILVVAIIVILASAAAVGIVEKINRANQNADAVRLHAAGGYFWKIEDGKVVELDPSDYDPNNPNHRSGGAMDMDFDKVKYIGQTVPNIPAEQYQPGSGGVHGGSGSGGNPVDPGTGGGDNPGNNPGGDNPGGGNNPGDNPGGGGAQNPVTPDDPVWNGHPESWWDEHDAEIEKKIQEAISKGVNPDDIKVTRDPETGHIIDHYIPAAPNNGSGNGNGNSGNGSGNGNGNGNSNPPSVGADSATVTLNAPSQYNLQATDKSFSGNGKPIKTLTITISDGATFTNVSAYDNGGKYKMSKSNDNKTVTITFDSSLGWASPESTLKVGNIQWSGSQNVQITYGFEYA